MKYRIGMILAIIGLGSLAFVAFAGSASAHNGTVTASCQGVVINANNYDGNKANKWSVTINGQTQSGTFGETKNDTFPVPQNGTASTWSGYVEAFDGSYHYENSGTTPICGTPPPVDVCPNLPGDQPTGTECSKEPKVETVVTPEESCELGGKRDVTSVTTTPYVYENGQWVLDTENASTVTTNGPLTPYTEEELVELGCVVIEEPPTEPPVVTPPPVKPPHNSPPTTPSLPSTGA